MKKILYTLFVLIFSFGCNEDFLEEFPTSYTTPEKLGEALELNPNVEVQGLLGSMNLCSLLEQDMKMTSQVQEMTMTLDIAGLMY